MPPTPNVEVGVGAWVVFNGELLMVKRAGAHGAGTWSIPGGWVEHGEQAENTAVREVKEETGIDVAAFERMGWSTDPDEFGRWITTLFINCAQTSEWQTPFVTEPDKCPEVAYVPLDRVMDRPLFEPLRSFLARSPEWLDIG